MPRLLGIDVGTTGARAVVIDEEGRVLEAVSAPYAPSHPKAGWSEQDPHDWVTAVRSCLLRLSGPVDATGFTGQMHGSVFLDEAGEPVRPALLWNDQRTVAECAEIEALVGSTRLREVTGNPPVTGFQAPKLLWLRRHEPEAWSRVRHVLLPKDFVRFALTGVRATDVSDASGTGLLDLGRRQWSEVVMAALDLDPDRFPRVYESASVVGRDPALGVVVAGAGDQAAGAVATGAVVPGVVSVSLGTSGVVFGTVSEPLGDPSGAAHVFAHANGGWHAMGVVLSCGGAVRWALSALFHGHDYDDMAEAAARAESDGVTFLPYLAGERTPINDPDARGVFAGLSLATGPAQLARAVFEGVTFALADARDALRPLGVREDEVRVTGGGARSGLWRQLLADVLGRTVHTLASDEGPAFGAAVLAGVGARLWPDLGEAVAATVRPAGATAPSGRSYGDGRARYRALGAALKDRASPP